MFQRWPKRDPNKHYYLVPNEVFNLGLSSHEIAVYNYLLRCEDRRTYQCHPSYRTIGKAVQLDVLFLHPVQKPENSPGTDPQRFR